MIEDKNIPEYNKNHKNTPKFDLLLYVPVNRNMKAHV